MREIPEQTRLVARTAFPRGALAMRVRDSLGAVFSDVEFAGLFARRGHPALSPAFLAMVSVLQYAEGLTDRQAADAVRGRLDWKYCLALELNDSGFDASVLSEFRSRLVTGEHSDRLLARVLQVLSEHDRLGPGGRQRTDATHVVADIRLLNRLELVAETMRAALEALAAAAPGWLAAHTALDWWDRYARRASDYRLPQALPARDELFRTVGQDGFRLLESAYGGCAPDWLREIPAVQVLRRVWVQQYYRDHVGRPGAREAKDLPPGLLRSAARTTPRPATASSGAWPGAGTRLISPKRARMTGPT